MLTIAISTFGARCNFIYEFNFSDKVKYLILLQGDDSYVDESYYNYINKLSNVQLLKLDTIGVAYSRNTAIEFCQTPWIWFMDDDVTIPDESIAHALTLINQGGQNNVFISEVKSPEGFDIKTYKLSHSSNIKSVLNVGTIQIIANATAIKNANVKFPINMGAGTENNLCDEPIFLHRLSKMINNLSFLFPSGLYVIHPLESSGIVYSTPGSVRSRAMLFRELYGFPLCIFASIYFLCKHRKKIGKLYMYIFSFKKAR